MMIKTLFALFTHLFVITCAGYVVIAYGCWWVNLLALLMVVLSCVGFVLVTTPDELTYVRVFKNHRDCKFCGQAKKDK